MPVAAAFPANKSSMYKELTKVPGSHANEIRIMRIVHMLPAFSILSYLAIAFPNSYVYLEGWTEVFQAIALYAFHMLLIDFIAPTERKRDEFFGKLKVKKLFRKNQYREGISWLKVSNAFHLLR